MKTEIERMLEKFNLTSEEDYKNALKEIMQEIALLGLWRSKFFEHAAFYGGTALRICHGLDRFSEDMDFTLLSPNPDFNISSYESNLERELESFGFEVTVEKKEKSTVTKIESTFLKANTMTHLLKIKAPFKTHRDEKIKIKLEIDTDPAPGFRTESVFHFEPIPYSIRLYDLPSLFSGKMHALLFRRRNHNIKGRDWYDFVWYVSKSVPLNLGYLKNKMVQTEDWPIDQPITEQDVKAILEKRIEGLDIESAKKDVAIFLKGPSRLDIWSKDFFIAASRRLKME
jgi:predicted nucleotidyltransferase component of viral defense system